MFVPLSWLTVRYFRFKNIANGDLLSHRFFQVCTIFLFTAFSTRMYGLCHFSLASLKGPTHQSLDFVLYEKNEYYILLIFMIMLKYEVVCSICLSLCVVVLLPVLPHK